MTGTYKFVVIGGAGGKETYNIEKDAEGGKGAQVTASINPVADETLTILVGGKGNDGPSAFDSSWTVTILAAIFGRVISTG